MRKAAWDAHIAKDAAVASRDAAWEVYLDAAKFLYAARETAAIAATASRDSNWDAYVSASEVLRAARKAVRQADIAEADYEKYLNGINSTTVNN